MNELYCGWRNYETWAGFCWLTSEEQSQKAIETAAGEALTATDGDKEAAVDMLAARLQDATEATAPDISGLYSDLLTYGLQHIDYQEIARHFIE